MREDTASTANRVGSLPLIGGVLALDFCNTASGRGSQGHQDHLGSAEDLIAWAGHAAILDAEREAQLQALCRADASFARRLLARGLRLRDAIFRLDSALTRRDAPDQADIDEIGSIYSACLAKGTLTTGSGGFGWTWRVETAPEETILGPIAASAMAVLTAADHGRLKQCAGHHCGWLFLDTTKSNTRRWCEMEVCGNRAKQKRRRDQPASVNLARD